MDKREISAEILKLDRARREYMAEYDEREYHPKLQVLREECEKTGHVWRFSNFGPFGHAWYMCTICKKSKREKDDDDDTTN